MLLNLVTVNLELSWATENILLLCGWAYSIIIYSFNAILFVWLLGVSGEKCIVQLSILEIICLDFEKFPILKNECYFGPVNDGNDGDNT